MKKLFVFAVVCAALGSCRNEMSYHATAYDEKTGNTFVVDLDERDYDGLPEDSLALAEPYTDGSFHLASEPRMADSLSSVVRFKVVNKFKTETDNIIWIWEDLAK